MLILLFVLSVLNNINDVLNKVAHTARNIRKEREQPQNKCDNQRTTNNTTDAEEHSTKEIHQVDLATRPVKIVKQIF